VTESLAPQTLHSSIPFFIAAPPPPPPLLLLLLLLFFFFCTTYFLRVLLLLLPLLLGLAMAEERISCSHFPVPLPPALPSSTYCNAAAAGGSSPRRSPHFLMCKLIFIRFLELFKCLFYLIRAPLKQTLYRNVRLF